MHFKWTVRQTGRIRNKGKISDCTQCFKILANVGDWNTNGEISGPWRALQLFTTNMEKKEKKRTDLIN